MSEEQLSRLSKEEETPSVKKTIKKGLSATQKTLAFVGSALGIITASITIVTFMHNNGSKKVPEKPVKTTIVKEIHSPSSSSVVASSTSHSSEHSHNLPSQFVSSSSMSMMSSSSVESSTMASSSISSSSVSESVADSSDAVSVVGSATTASE